MASEDKGIIWKTKERFETVEEVGIFKTKARQRDGSAVLLFSYAFDMMALSVKQTK